MKVFFASFLQLTCKFGKHAYVNAKNIINMTKKYNIAIVGATGIVGKEFLKILPERNFPYDKVYAVASKNSKGKEVSLGEKDILKVEDLAKFDFSKVDFAFFSAGGNTSEKYAPIAAEKGAIVIDNTSHFRMQEDVPLIVPEVNSHVLKNYGKGSIIANPNCSTIQMVLPLAAMNEIAEIKRVVVSTYQSVAGAGKSAMDELYEQTKSVYAMQDFKQENFTKRIAFNAIPHIDVFMPDGSTKEEWKMIVETKKIMEEDINVSATCVRLPVFVGHAESVNVEFTEKFDLEKIIEVLEDFDGITLQDKREDGGYVSPIEVVGEDDVFISRLRIDPSQENSLNFWCVADNVRKGGQR